MKYNPNGLTQEEKLVKQALSGKQDTLTAGENITITNNVISATGGGGGTTVHNNLTGRDASDCHGIDSITGLRDTLDILEATASSARATTTMASATTATLLMSVSTGPTFYAKVNFTGTEASGQTWTITPVVSGFPYSAGAKTVSNNEWASFDITTTTATSISGLSITTTSPSTGSLTGIVRY